MYDSLHVYDVYLQDTSSICRPSSRTTGSTSGRSMASSTSWTSSGPTTGSQKVISTYCVSLSLTLCNIITSFKTYQLCSHGNSPDFRGKGKCVKIKRQYILSTYRLCFYGDSPDFSGEGNLCKKTGEIFSPCVVFKYTR